MVHTFIGEKEMADIINYESGKLRSMLKTTYSAKEYVEHAEEEISLLGEKMIKSLLDDGYSPLRIVEIFSEYFDTNQVLDAVALHVGKKTLLELENIEKLREIKKENPKVNL